MFGLADLQGEEWRKMKRLVTPSFSVPRLKKTVASINVAALKMTNYLKKVESKEFINSVDLLKGFYMTTVASVVFGMNIDCFGETESEFEKHGKTLLDMMKFAFNFCFPNLSILFRVHIVNSSSERFFTNLFKHLVKERKAKDLEVKDILGNLMHVAEENPAMTEEMMYKTCVQFLTDGYETASQATGIIIYNLARCPEIQEQLQDEIDMIFENKEEKEDIDEKDLNEMPYLDQV